MASKQATKSKKRPVTASPPFEYVALLLQGGGALGAYQAGVYEAMAEAKVHPNWLAGISIGAINGAIIAGNPPEDRVAKLRKFWETISKPPLATPFADALRDMANSETLYSVFSEFNAQMAVVAGADGFFRPRLPGPMFERIGSPEATSVYDTSHLKSTLESLADFDRINHGGIRYSVGAVNVRTGNFVYFDSKREKIRPEHVMASGALPPGFPAIEIDGQPYWDGGLVSNTPLNYIMRDTAAKKDFLAFQVDLWSAAGHFPRHLGDVETRQKEIRYSSKTRAKTNNWKRVLRYRSKLATLLDKLPPELADSEEAKDLSKIACRNVYNIVHLIYRSRAYEGHAKDHEFSRYSMETHWKAGYADAARTLKHREIFERPVEDCFQTFDFHRETAG